MQDIGSIYKELQQTNFLTPYSTYGPGEDSAEAATFWALEAAGQGPDFQILSSTGKIYFSSRGHSESSKLESKEVWLKTFFGKEDLRYRTKRVN